MLPLFYIALHCVFGAAMARKFGDRPPNIVYILADDMGYGDIGPFGNPTISTPNLNRLASRGIKMTQFYTGSPICTPSRAAFLTGRLPPRSGVMTGHEWPEDNLFRVFYPSSKGSLPREELTVAELLKGRGYATSLIGKWHLGHFNDSLPFYHGFDEFYGLPYSQDEGCMPQTPSSEIGKGDKRKVPVRGAPAFSRKKKGAGAAMLDPESSPEPIDCHGWHVIWPPVPVYDNVSIVEQPVDLSTITPRYTSRALDFIERNKENPFFLYLAFDEVHVQLFASPEFVNTSRRGPFGDALEEMDHAIGQVMGKLESLGLNEDTLVVFFSDNGPWVDQGIEGGSTGGFRGQKGSTWEGGVRVPAIAVWDGVIPAGATTMELGTSMDLFTTALGLANATVPTDRVIDGVDLMPVLKGGASLLDKFFYYRDHTLMAARVGPFKAHFVTRPGFGPEPPIHHDPPILYQIEHDPQENHPLDAKDYASVIEGIKSAVEEHKAGMKMGPPQLDEQDFAVVPCCKNIPDPSPMECVCAN